MKDRCYFRHAADNYEEMELVVDGEVVAVIGVAEAMMLQAQLSITVRAILDVMRRGTK